MCILSCEVFARYSRDFLHPLATCIDSLFVESFLGCQSCERRSLFPLIRSSEALSVSLTEFEEGEFSLDTFSSSVTIALPRLWWKEY